MKVSVDGLEDAVRAELEQYASEVQEEVDSAVVRVARRCLAQIRRNSPKKTGDYRKGWTMKTEKGRLNTVALIYNRTRYFLIHLLREISARHGHGTPQSHAFSSNRDSGCIDNAKRTFSPLPLFSFGNQRTGT